MYSVTTKFYDNNKVDLGKKIVSKSYLMSYYPGIANNIITPELWTWGRNSYGQLGVNDSQIRSTPVTTFAGAANWKQIASGRNHSVAIKTDGTLWLWGFNNFGRLGVNDLIPRSTPITTFAGGNDWKSVDTTLFSTCAIKTDGTLWVWGYNISGQLGVNDTLDRLTPVTTFAGGNDWKQVSGGYLEMGAIKTDGTLWVWGRNELGQLGTNAAGSKSTPVTTFAGGNDWKNVYFGLSNMTAIKNDGTLWGCGFNAYGQLGVNDTSFRNTPVTTFAGGTDWKQISGGLSITTAIKTDGTLWIWGRNLSGQLGTNDTSNRLTPVTTFTGGTDWKQVVCSNTVVDTTVFTTAIKTDGTLWTWGANNTAQLGVNDTSNRLTPVTTFAGGTNWKQVQSGETFTIAIKSIEAV